MNDPLQDIHHYSPTLTIAQVIKFCEKKALPVSRPMVQNYIRDGLLPPPVNKRIYTHKHLAALVMICRLKTVYDMPAIRTALVPHMDEEGLSLETYKWLLGKQKEALELWLANVAPNIAAEDENSQALLIMAHAADIKDLTAL
ncbi:MAG: DUF1836 domain-containing protein [Defluviitaleaceae bacterium]|nr:DUF1836 domain-containing protein [Defluviitaleaceae bacterium]